MNWSYKLGTDSIGMLTENAKEFTRAASILGVFIVGALTCAYGATSLNVIIPNGTTFTATPTTAVVTEAQLPEFDEICMLRMITADTATFSRTALQSPILTTATTKSRSSRTSNRKLRSTFRASSTGSCPSSFRSR